MEKWVLGECIVGILCEILFFLKLKTRSSPLINATFHNSIIPIFHDSH
jgi:hypothetical protein